MRLNVRRALATAAAATIALSTVALQPAEARRYHRHHNGAGPVILGTFGALAFMAAANEYGGYPYYGYSNPYPGYPYGPGAPYWNGHRFVYGPVYGGPIYGPPGGYWR